jgi:superinfection exclusion protein B
MAVLCVISALLFFLPARVLHAIALDEFASHNRTPISLVFWFTLLMTFSYAVQSGWEHTIAKFRSRRIHQSLVARLQALDSQEKAVLKQFIDSDRRTCNFDYEHGAVAALIYSGVLFHPIDTADIRYFPTTIADWAWDYLRNHRELLK